MLQREHSAILSTFIKLPVVIKAFVLSIFEWPFYTGFTVYNKGSFIFLHVNNFLLAESGEFDNLKYFTPVFRRAIQGQQL